MGFLPEFNRSPPPRTFVSYRSGGGFVRLLSAWHLMGNTAEFWFLRVSLCVFPNLCGVARIVRSAFKVLPAAGPFRGSAPFPAPPGFEDQNRGFR